MIDNKDIYKKECSCCLILDLHVIVIFNSLPNDKTLDQSKFKALADDKINAIKTLKFILGE